MSAKAKRLTHLRNFNDYPYGTMRNHLSSVHLVTLSSDRVEGVDELIAMHEKEHRGSAPEGTTANLLKEIYEPRARQMITDTEDDNERIRRNRRNLRRQARARLQEAHDAADAGRYSHATEYLLDAVERLVQISDLADGDLSLLQIRSRASEEHLRRIEERLGKAAPVDEAANLRAYVTDIFRENDGDVPAWVIAHLAAALRGDPHQGNDDRVA